MIENRKNCRNVGIWQKRVLPSFLPTICLLFCLSLSSLSAKEFEAIGSDNAHNKQSNVLKVKNMVRMMYPNEKSFIVSVDTKDDKVFYTLIVDIDSKKTLLVKSNIESKKSEVVVEDGISDGARLKFKFIDYMPSVAGYLIEFREEPLDDQFDVFTELYEYDSGRKIAEIASDDALLVRDLNGDGIAEVVSYIDVTKLQAPSAPMKPVIHIYDNGNIRVVKEAALLGYQSFFRDTKIKFENYIRDEKERCVNFFSTEDVCPYEETILILQYAKEKLFKK